MKRKTVGMTLRAAMLALALILVAGSPALPPFAGAAYAQNAEVSDLSWSARPNGTLQLSWTAVDDAESYRLWKGTGSGRSVSWGTAALVTVDAPAVSYTDSAVAAGMTYSYVVEVYEGDTRLGWSDVVNVTMPGGVQAPTAQPVVTLEAEGSDAIRITWTAVAGATHYQVRYWTAGLTGWMDVAADQVERMVTHRGLTTGSQYFYIVRGQNAGGNGPYSGAPGQYDSLTLQEMSPTPVLTANHTSRTTVELSWTAVADAATYTLEHRRRWIAAGATEVTDATTQDWQRVSLTTTSYTHDRASYIPDSAARVMYDYRVRATDTSGLTGDFSNTETVAIPRLGAILSAPGGFAVAAINDSSIRVTWNAHPVAAFYQLRWKVGDGAYTDPIRVDGVSYVHSGLTPETMYTYQVRGVNLNGPGNWTAEASVTTPAVGTVAPAPQLQIPQVTGLTVTDATQNNNANPRRARLTWDPVAGATHYEIYRFNPRGSNLVWERPPDGNNLAGGFITVANAGETAPTWEDVIASSGFEGAAQTYYYIVSAVEDGLDNNPATGEDNQMGAWSDYDSVTFLDFRPVTPISLTVGLTTPTSVQIKWTSPVAQRNGVPPTGVPTSWTVRYRSYANPALQTVHVPGPNRQLHHTGLDNTTTYSYQVQAHNAAGSSAWSDFVQIELGNDVSPPTGLRVEDATTNNAHRLRITWNAAPGADGYHIQRYGAGADNDQWGTLDDMEGFTDLSLVTETIDANNLFGNAQYLYRVRTVKEGTQISAWSAPAAGVTTSFWRGGAPYMEGNGIGPSMIRVAWETIIIATGYQLEYVEGDQDAAYFNDTNPRRIELGANVNTYIITGLKPGTQYSFRLRALFRGGYTTDWRGPGGTGKRRAWTAPSPPSVTTESVDSSNIRLRWSPTTEYLGSSTGTYRVEWRLASSGANGAWAAVAESVTGCDAGACTLLDGGLTPGTEYQYRIRAEAHADHDEHKSYWTYVRQRTPADTTP